MICDLPRLTHPLVLPGIMCRRDWVNFLGHERKVTESARLNLQRRQLKNTSGFRIELCRKDGGVEVLFPVC
jgi:hypothetical protein